MPTIPQVADGQIIEPSVSVPMPIAARFAAIAEPVPEDEPHGFRSKTYGLRVCPPRPLQPLEDFVERKFAHSLKFVLPIMTAPALRNCETINASCFGVGALSSARLPAVVCILSAVSMLSFIKIGMPCSAPRTRLFFRSLSESSAILRASEFVSITEFSFGSIVFMRSRYFSTIFFAEISPALNFLCSSETVVSSNSSFVSASVAEETFFASAFFIKLKASGTAALACKNSRRVFFSVGIFLFYTFEGFGFFNSL